MEVIETPNGVCNKVSPRGISHGMKLNVNGQPVCLKCQSEAEQAARTVIPVVTASDPGPDAFLRGGHLKPEVKKTGGKTVTMMDAKTGLPVDGSAPQGYPADAKGKAEPEYSRASIGQAVPNAAGRLQIIRAAIYGLPMPKSMTQYKRFLKIQQLIDQCISEEENG